MDSLLLVLSFKECSERLCRQSLRNAWRVKDAVGFVEDLVDFFE